MKRNARTTKSDGQIFRSLSPEECRSIKGGEESGGSLLAFPFIQQAMQSSTAGQGSNG